MGSPSWLQDDEKKQQQKNKNHTYLRRSSELQNRFQQMFDGRWNFPVHASFPDVYQSYISVWLPLILWAYECVHMSHTHTFLGEGRGGE